MLKASLRCPAKRRLRLLREAAKSSGVVDSQVRQNPAVGFHARLLQSIDELAVAHAIQFGGGASAHDPGRANMALLLASPGEGELQAAVYGLLRRPVEF